MVYSFVPQKLETKWAESENGEASILHRYHHVFISASAEEKFGQDGEKMRPQQLPAYNPTVWAGEGNRPRKNNLVGNSPNLISHTVALVIINITWHFPFQKVFFWLFFKSVKLHFPQRDLLGPKSSLFFWEKGKRKIILLWPCHWETASHLQRAQKVLLTFLSAFSQKKRRNNAEQQCSLCVHITQARTAELKQTFLENAALFLLHTPSHRIQMWGWDHLSLLSYSFSFFFFFWSLLSCFHGIWASFYQENILTSINEDKQATQILTSWIVVCLCNFQLKTLWFCVI